jgi:exopolysaccharide production protein ExoQ
MIESRRFRTVFAAFALFSLFAGDFWRYLIGWWGFGVIAVTLTVLSVILIVKQRHSWRVSRLPFPLLAFLALATLSILWSFYPGASALGILTTWMTVTIAAGLAITFNWDELLRSLGHAFRFILGLSLVFEFIVSAFIRQPILPLVPSPGIDYDSYEKIPKLLFWSRDLLFDGGKIQGIIGNSSLLGFVALLALIVFGLQYASRTVGRFWGAFWIVVAVVTVFLTRSATITVAIVIVALVLVAILLIRRTSGRSRLGVYGAIALLVVAAVTTVIVANKQLLALLGKSEDLTGRLDIWNIVIEHAQQRPAFGWGWVSFWVPWVAPFDDMVFKAGIRQLHAHNAWLDIWLQLGILGLIVFGALVLSSTVRAWSLATDAEVTSPDLPGRYRAVTLLPILLMVALLVQSLAESRLLIEYGMLLLAIIAIRTKADAP